MVGKRIPAITPLATIEFIAAACILLQCRTIWMHLENIGMMFNRASFIVLAICLVLLICYDKEGQVCVQLEKTHVQDAIIVTLFFAVFILVNPINYLRVVRCAVIFVLMILLLAAKDSWFKIRGILLKYKNIVVVVAAISVICWVTLSLLHLYDYPWSGDVYVDWSDDGNIIRRSRFLYIYFETQWFITGYVARNSSIFVEGPMAAYAFSIALLLELYVEKHTTRAMQIFCRVSLVLAILTTFTTTGYLVLAILLGIILFNRIKNSTNKIGKIIPIVIVVILVITCAILLSMKITSKASGSVRIDDVIAAIKAWRDKPWFGGGFENQKYINRYMSAWRLNNLGFSNSPFEILANGGIYLVSIYAYAFIKSMINIIKSKNTRAWPFFVIFTMLFSITIIPYQYITSFILVLLTYDRVPYAWREDIET